MLHAEQKLEQEKDRLLQAPGHSMLAQEMETITQHIMLHHSYRTYHDTSIAQSLVV